jgi:hypothetical protein
MKMAATVGSLVIAAVWLLREFRRFGLFSSDNLLFPAGIPLWSKSWSFHRGILCATGTLAEGVSDGVATSRVG